MAEPKTFSSVKLICGIISSADEYFNEAEKRLMEKFGDIDLRSPAYEFDTTDYYEPQMGKGLRRKFLSFARLIAPEALAGIKIKTNALEEEIRRDLEPGLRIVNLDPGYLTPAALIMATAKDFAHRIPLQDGIYAHLEFLFSKQGIKFLDWTYPDFRKPECPNFFNEVRRRYLNQLR